MCRTTRAKLALQRARSPAHTEAAAAAAALFLSRSMSHNVLRDYGPLATLSSSPLKKSTTGAVGCKWVAKINLLMQPGGRLPRPRARGLSNAHHQIENEKLIRPVPFNLPESLPIKLLFFIRTGNGRAGVALTMECDLSRISLVCSALAANVYCARAAMSEERRATRRAFYCCSCCRSFAERGQSFQLTTDGPFNSYFLMAFA